MEFKDYYKIMGVSPGASADEIKRAYRVLARKYHPDVSKESNAEAQFKEVGEAYAVLSDPEKRKAYDQLRQGGYQAGQEFNVPPGWDFRAQQAGPGQQAEFEDFSDFFANLFGGGFGEGRGGFHTFRQRSGRPHGAFRSRGEDATAAITITLPEAFHGTTRSLQLQIPELDSQGNVAAKTKTLNVKVPAGVKEGQKIRLQGQGGTGWGGGPSGDLYLEIHIAPDSIYHLDGQDITLPLPITPWEAALGATVEVPTLSGKFALKIPSGSQTGTKMRLKGKGLPGHPSGDLYVLLQVVVPPANTEAAQQLYQTMAKEMPFDPRKNLRAE